MIKSPLQVVKEKFGDKAKLVEAIQKEFLTEDLWVQRISPRKGLEHVSNTKLLRLHETLSAVKGKFGTRDKLIDAIAELESRAKDEGFRQKLAHYPVPRLYDLWKTAQKHASAAQAKAKSAEAKPRNQAGSKTKQPRPASPS